jgi:hypothetical protein
MHCTPLPPARWRRGALAGVVLAGRGSWMRATTSSLVRSSTGP